MTTALSEPLTTPPARWVLSLTLVNLAIMSGWFGPIQVLLAEQAREISPAHKEVVLSLVLGVGALVSTVSNPLFGALSDRTTLRVGRRRPVDRRRRASAAWPRCWCCRSRTRCR